MKKIIAISQEAAATYTKVVVRFSGPVPHHAQGVAMLEMERTLRRMTGRDVRVFKDLMQDDSKLRVMMTDSERSEL